MRPADDAHLPEGRADPAGVDLEIRVVAGLRSAPEQNPSPAPVITSTRSLGVSATSSNTSMSSRHIGPLMAFFFSGRLSVTVTTPSARSTMSVSMRPYRSAVGFNPFRKQVRRSSDIVIVVAALAVVAALLVWAVLRAEHARARHSSRLVSRANEAISPATSCSSRSGAGSSVTRALHAVEAERSAAATQAAPRHEVPVILASGESVRLDWRRSVR